jgi:hypothetical protein
MIKRAICDRACLSGSHGTFRVRFAPHALGRDENARHIVFAFEHGGGPGQASLWFPVDRLHGLQRNADPWCTGSPESRPQSDLSEIEAAVDDPHFCADRLSLGFAVKSNSRASSVQW